MVLTSFLRRCWGLKISWVAIPEIWHTLITSYNLVLIVSYALDQKEFGGGKDRKKRRKKGKERKNEKEVQFYFTGIPAFEQ